MLDFSIASRRLRVPEPDRIPCPAVADALTGLVKLRSAIDQAHVDRNAADALVAELRNRGGLHLAESYLADPFDTPADPNDELEDAEHAARDAQTRMAGLDAAQGLGWNRYAGAVDADRVPLSKALATRVPPALLKLSSAVKLMRDAEAALAESLDTLAGLAAGEYSAKLGGPGTYAVPLSQAIELAAQALAAAQEQLEALRPGKAATS